MLHVTIGSMATNGINLEKDLRSVKTAILYADKAKLCSHVAALAWSMNNFNVLPLGSQINLFEKYLCRFLRNERDEDVKRVISTIRTATQKKHPGRNELLLISNAKKVMKQGWEAAAKNNFGLLSSNEVRALQKAVEAGLLEIHPFEHFKNTEAMFDTVFDETRYGTQAEPALQEYIRVICDAMSDRNTYPLLDDWTGQLVKSGIELGLIKASLPVVEQGKQSALAADLFERLPVFDEATIEEVIDIRKELELPLIRFRGAVSGFSEKIKTAAWDADFSAEARNVFVKEVGPTVLDIEDRVKSTPSLAELVLKGLAVKGTAASLFSFFISQVAALEPLATLAIGSAVGATSVVYEALREYQKLNRETGQNKLYFYYRAGKYLQDRTFEYES